MRYEATNLLRTENDVEFYDIFQIDWNAFTFDSFTIHSVTEEEAKKPWIISFNEYGKTDYEDLIFAINKVMNPMKLYVGQRLKIPTERNIYTFLQRYVRVTS